MKTCEWRKGSTGEDNAMRLEEWFSISVGGKICMLAYYSNAEVMENFEECRIEMKFGKQEKLRDLGINNATQMNCGSCVGSGWLGSGRELVVLHCWGADTIF